MVHRVITFIVFAALLNVCFSVRAQFNAQPAGTTQPGRITGTVLDRLTNEPIPAAVIMAHSSGYQTETVTDNAGRYELILESPGRCQLEIDPPATHAITIEYAWQDAHVAGGDVLVVDWRLDCAVTVAGIVRDSQGRPVGGAAVKIEVGNTNYDPVTTTDGAGQFHVAMVPARCRFYIEVDTGAEISDSRRQYTAEGRPIYGLDVVLTRPAALGGRIVDSFNSPMAGAWVDVHSAGGLAADELGRFGKDKLWPGRYTISVTPANETSGRRQRLVTLDLAPGERRNDLVLVYSPSRDLSISGRVADFEGRPISNAQLFWITKDGSFAEYTQSTSDGSYVLHDLQPGDYLLAGINYKDENYGHDRTIRGMRRAAAGSENVNFHVALNPPRPEPRSFFVQVTAEDTGRPITELDHVFLEFRGESIEGDEVSPYRILARSESRRRHDTAGRIPVELRPGARYGLGLRAAGYGMWLGYIDAMSRLSIALEPEARLTGRVVDRNGQPITGVVLVYDRLIDEIAPAPNEFGYLGGVFADGSFDIGGLPLGEVPVTFVHGDFVPTRVVLRTDRGGTANSPVTLQRAGVIRGVVTLNGVPVPDVYVQVVDQELLQRHGVGGVTDENGRFEVSRLRLGQSKVYAAIPGFDDGRRQTRDTMVEIREGDVFDLDFHFASSP